MADSMRGSESFGRSVAGSEEAYACDVCRNKDLDCAAVVVCSSCDLHLCTSCRDVHSSTSDTADHVLQSLSATDDGHKSTVDQGTNASVEERCRHHPEKPLKFYCTSHHQLACGVCSQSHHMSCKNYFLSINDLSSQPAAKTELQNTLTDLKKLVTTLENSQQQLDQCQQQTEDSYEKLLQDIKHLRHLIDKQLDKLEREVIDKANKMKQESLNYLKTLTSVKDNLLQEMEMSISNLEKCQQKLDNQAFITTKLSLEKLKSFEAEAGKVINSASVSRFIFNAESRLDIVTKLAEFGTVSLVNKLDDVKPKYLHNLCVKANSDEVECGITSMCVIHDGRLALTDHDNKCVKILDVTSNQVTDKLSLQVEPFDIALVTDHQLAVVVKKQRYFQLVDLCPGLTLGDTVALPGMYNGVTYSEGRLILACYAPVAIHICDMSGQLLQRIDYSNGDMVFVGTPSYMTVSPDKSSLYITDWRGNQLVCLGPDGVVKERYTSGRLRSPAGVTTDDRGQLYVCSNADHSVHRLDASCRRGKVVLEHADGLRFPRAIAIHNNVLYVCSNSKTPADCNYLRVFSIKPQPPPPRSVTPLFSCT